MTALLTIAAVLLDAALGEPRRWHPLVGFGRWAQYLERALNPEARLANAEDAGREASGRGRVSDLRFLDCGASHRPSALRLRGVLAVLMAVGPWVVLVFVLAASAPSFSPGGTSVASTADAAAAVGAAVREGAAVGGPAAVAGAAPAAGAVSASPTRYLGLLVSIAALYFALGHQSLRDHAQRVHHALTKGDLEDARAKVGCIVSRDTGQMDAQAVASGAVESVLENGNDAVFGALFWFLIAGAPGVLLYRLANTLDAMWGYRTPRYLYFGWAAARLDDVLNFVPARLTALTYALIGHTRSALHCWRLQAGAWDSPNAGPVMAAGAGALGIGLGGGAYYHGEWEERPTLGIGPRPDATAIPAALRLVRLGVILWLLVVIAIEGVVHA
jgi:adenosylcobinamide-phosphate synthase